MLFDNDNVDEDDNDDDDDDHEWSRLCLVYYSSKENYTLVSLFIQRTAS